MPDEREILKYQLDISDVEAKTARVNQLTASITEGRARGEDTSVLEQQLGGELDALNKLSPVQKQAATETEKLLREKEKLGAVVNLLGGGFGGLTGQVASVVQLFMTATPVIGGVVAALAGVSAAMTAWESIKGKIAEVTAELERQRDVQAELQRGRVDAQKAIDTELEKFGAKTPEKADAAAKLEREMRMQFGIEGGQATAAMMAAAGRGNVEEAAVLNAAMKQGLDVQGPGEVGLALDTLRRRGQYDRLREQLDTGKRTTTARQVRAAAESDYGGEPASDPDSLTFEALRKSGALPKEITSPGKLATFMDRFGSLRDRVRSGEKMQLTSADDAGIGRPIGSAIDYAQFEKVYEEADARRRGLMSVDERDAGGRTRSVGAEPGEAVSQRESRQVINNFNQYIGTVRNHLPEQRAVSAIPSISKSPTGGG